MKQKTLSATLDPAWDEFDGFYLNQHGNHFFTISPQFSSETTADSASFGPLDQAMLSILEENFSSITGEILANATEAKTWIPPIPNPENKSFYRIVADWGVDSNGGGRYDWEQLLIDGTNPFGPGSGPGGSDLSSAGGGSGTYPSPGATAPVQPLAWIEQQSFMFNGASPSQGTVFIDNGVIYSQGDYEALEAAASVSFAAFKNVADGLALPQDERWASPLNSFSNTVIQFTIPEDDENGTPEKEVIKYTYTRTRFRLKLDSPAPAGGYSIPFRVGIVRQDVIEVQNGLTILAPAIDGEIMHVDLPLTCPEGHSEGPPVEFQPLLGMAANQTFTYVPASVSTRENDIIYEGDVENAIPGPIPDNGTCTVENGLIIANFGNPFAKYPRNYLGSPLQIQWRKRQLFGNGTFAPWTDLTKTGYAAEPCEGVHVHIPAKNRGIFQMQARLMLPNGAKIEYPFVRMRDARSIRDSSTVPRVNKLLEAGSPDYFGVCGNYSSKLIRDKAVTWLGSTTYSAASNVPVIPGNLLNPNLIDKDKCNLFVTHTSISCGLDTPFFYVRGIRPSAPIARDDWYGEPEKHIDLDRPGWIYEGQDLGICPGEIVAGYGAGRASGHVGIIDYDGSWIGSGPKNINKFIHFINMDTHYRPYATRSR